MPGFKFRLQAVLDYKETLEEKARENFARAQQYYLERQALLAEARQRQAALLAAMADTIRTQGDKKPVPVAERVGAELYLERLRQEVALREQLLARAAEELERRRRELTLMRQGRQVFANLREKARRVYQQEQNRQEQKKNDEFARNTYLRHILERR